jgi:hypothetical protein
MIHRRGRSASLLRINRPRQWITVPRHADPGRFTPSTVTLAIHKQRPVVFSHTKTSVRASDA